MKHPAASSSWKTLIFYPWGDHLYISTCYSGGMVLRDGGGKWPSQVGEQRVQLHAGESVLAPRLRAAHISAVGATPGRLLREIAFCPAGENGAVLPRAAPKSKGSAGDAAFIGRYEMKWLALLRFGSR